jgi:hypothetical protein
MVLAAEVEDDGEFPMVTMLPSRNEFKSNHLQVSRPEAERA